MVFKVKQKKPVKIPMWEIERKNIQIGHHWFEPATKRFFRSKIPNEAIKRGNYAYFVTSETNPNNETKFSIRKADLKTGIIHTEGEFFKYNSRAEANMELKKILQKK